MSEIAIVGSGAWGTALAIVLGRKRPHCVRLWAHEKEVCESIAGRLVNQLFLPGMSIPQNVCPTNDLEAALRGAQIIVSAMPSHHCRRLFSQMAETVRPEMLIISATKGLENETLMRMTEVIAEELGVLEDGFRPRL